MKVNPLAAAAELLLGVRIRTIEPLSGGDLSQVLRLILADGRTVLIKNGPAPKAEAAMLRAITRAKVPAPEVLAVDDRVLILEELPHDGRINDAWANLGAALACLHTEQDDLYGWETDYAFGSLPIVNARQRDWPAFWAEHRLLPFLPRIQSGLRQRVERLAGDLPNRLPRHPMPVLLHGDLWSGNILVARGKITGLIDPACYYGHAEADLGMLTLFDRPSAAFYDHYPVLMPGHAERITIYRLWPALVHLYLFGGAYFHMVDGLLSELGV